MLSRLISFSIKQRLFILVMVGALLVAGIRAFIELPIEAFPDVQDVQVQVITQVVGQAPEEVERSVTIPIEREMSGIPQMTQLRSVSITGLSVITMIFADGTEDRLARAQVLEKLQTVDLPDGVTPTLGPLTTAVGEIYRYVVDAPPNLPLYEVRAIQDWIIRPELRRVPGVADVVGFGGSVKEIQVDVDPNALRKFGLTLDQISQALRENNANTGGGIIRRGGEGLVLRAIGLFHTVEDVAATVIMSHEGKAITVGDVATIEISGHTPLSGIVSLAQQGDNGKILSQDSIVEGIVLMIKGSDPSKIIQTLKTRVDELNSQSKLPEGVHIRPIYERTQLVDHTVATVGENLLLGALLVVAVLIVFLRDWRTSLIVACIIPLTLLFAFIMMNARGVSANLISLGAVDFGIIIDSAVVLVEALMVRLMLRQEPGSGQDTAKWRINALRQTAINLGKPILFSKAIIVLAFVPIFTFQRVEGKIFSPVAFTLSFALIGAIILTLTLVPALLSYLLQRSSISELHLAWMERLKTGYRKLLDWTDTRPRIMAGITIASLAGALTLLPVIGTEFLPKLDEGNIWLTIALPPSIHLEQSKEVERAIRAKLITYPEVKTVVAQVGRPDDGTDPKGANNLEILADLNPRSSWRFSSKEKLVADMSHSLKAIPGLPTNFSQIIQDNVEESLSGVKGEIAIKVFGPDLEILEDKAEQIVTLLNHIRGAVDVAAIKVGGQTEVTVTPDRQKLARYGISIAEINTLFQTAFGGSAITRFYEGERRFNVNLRLAPDYRHTITDIANLQIAIPGSTGAFLTLGELARIDVRQGASRIAREAGGRAVSVKANLMGRDQGSFVSEAQKKVAEHVHLPPGYRITWGGQFENQQRAMKRLMIIVPASLLGIFVLLFWAFKSLRSAFIILLIAPLTLIGGLTGLALSGLHLSISAAVGFIAVSGIAVQNGVIMVEEIVGLIHKGQSFAEAVREGAVLRLRPILMTALMAGLGLLPAALSHGIGSETQRPFAVVIVGGIISATFFTLVLLPLMFNRLARPKHTKPRENP
ncbi:CusA/CzcA family heavy metal efflux RND transporter [Nitrosomonas sp. H1_AOB3]|uniref:efflux RND transporter permease subunit n=1 Tax=Nitrosomonas sp. H1_AOB3 TaxID=2741553 RepID=UPI00193645F1|nr:CusA/CzcA family heavy metal efflux RND transporter [Nitrosomonas sp. H1_AOB3]QOJ09546.1 MAG: efflux RND transporter permease subunit [Nitrosomonas sp. H1_AOB3]